MRGALPDAPATTGHDSTPRLAVIGGGPAGLMAAQVARAAGIEVDVYEAKGSVGRKFLIAGKGGLNLTHSEPRPGFDARYRERQAHVAAWLDDFDADALRDWACGLGVDTYVGSSGRVFPSDRKAAPLLRGWVRRLREDGVRFHVHHRWTGWTDDGALRFDMPADGGPVSSRPVDGAPTDSAPVDSRPADTAGAHAGSAIGRPLVVRADAVVLALGGGSWPELGSDGAWVPWLAARGIDVAALQPSNCGFDIGWSEHFASRHAGAPLKPVVAHWRDTDGGEHALQGECVVTATGIEGSLVYALSAPLREAIARDGTATLVLDLAPGRDAQRLQQDLARPRNGRSLSEHLRRHAGIEGAKAALLYEVLGRDAGSDLARLAATIKRLPLVLQRARPIAEAISSAGGVRLEGVDEALMLRALPGVFVAGEMLDWEAPTGGYLLTACFASGWRAGHGAVAWLRRGRDVTSG